MNSTAVVGDFNGDGIPDLAYMSTSSYAPPGTQLQNSLNIVLGFGGANSKTVTTPMCSSNLGPVGFAVGDVNNDKKLDVVFNCNGYVNVPLGNGDGSFQNPAYYAVNTTNATPVLADLNGDGYLDVAVLSSGTNASPAQVIVFLNEGSSGPGIYGTAKTFTTGTYALRGNLLTGDFNGDGKQDLSVATGTGFVFLFGNGDGTFQPPQNQPVSASASAGTVTGDFNSDGITDIAYVSGAQFPTTLQWGSYLARRAGFPAKARLSSSRLRKRLHPSGLRISRAMANLT